LSDAQLLRNVLVAIARRNELENRNLPGRHRLAYMLGELDGQLWREIVLARMHMLDRAHQFLWTTTLQNVRTGASCECALYLHVALESGQHEDPGIGTLLPDGSDGRDSAHVGQA